MKKIYLERLPEKIISAQTAPATIACFMLLLLFQTGCQSFVDQKKDYADYKKAAQMEKTAMFYYQEDEMDSALKCYRRSLAVMNNLRVGSFQGKNRLYSREISAIDSAISNIYITYHLYDSALYYETNALNQAYEGQLEIPAKGAINHTIANIYIQLAEKDREDTAKAKQYYHKALKYAVAACWEIDSAGIHSDVAAGDYYLAMQLYDILGDTNRKRFYMDKYLTLHRYLPLREPEKLNAPAPVHKHTKVTTSNTDEDHKQDTALQNNNGTMSNSIIIDNGVETIITKMNGVVVKKEIKKL